VAYAGRPEDLAEPEFLNALGVSRHAEGTSPPLSPWRWREHVRAEWSLVSDAPAASPAARVRRMPWVPDFPADARIIRRNQDGLALVGLVPRFGGRLLLVPAEALANARLGQEGNADLLEALIRMGPRQWLFDEYHHGLTAAASRENDHSARAFQLWIAHLALVYLLAVLALARRFGPAWNAPLVTSGSTRSFFLGIGALHARLRHQREAAPLLVARARELHPTARIPESPDPKALDDDAFVRFAQAVARAQQRRR
jgi:hypothetical protein